MAGYGHPQHDPRGAAHLVCDGTEARFLGELRDGITAILERTWPVSPDRPALCAAAHFQLPARRALPTRTRFRLARQLPNALLRATRIVLSFYNRARVQQTS